MAYFQAQYSSRRENDRGCDEDEDDTNDSNVAGVRNPARYSQPNMFTLLSWEGDTNNDTDFKQNQQIVIEKEKPKVFNRWESEAAYQFQVGGRSKPTKTPNPPKPPDNIVVDNMTGPTPVSMSFMEKEKPECSTVSAPKQTASEQKLNVTVTKKQERIRSAQKRRQVKARASSRGVADSAFSEAYRRPVFHNYGRANNTNPWTDHHNLESYNAQAHQARTSPPTQTKRSTTKFKPPALCHIKPTSPSQPEPDPSLQKALKNDEPLSTLTALVVPPTPPQLGYSSHIRAPRIRSPPPQSEMPVELTKLSAKQHNNPRFYRTFQPEWTSVIMAAGTPNLAGESVAECLKLFE